LIDATSILIDTLDLDWTHATVIWSDDIAIERRGAEICLGGNRRGWGERRCWQERTGEQQ
jgi:hypothetical protein